MLFILPGHLGVSGVTTWAARAVRLLRAAHRPAGLLVHEADGRVPTHLADLAVGCIAGPPIDERRGQLGDLIEPYRRAIEAVAQPGAPTAVAPMVPGDCVGVVAAITQAWPETVRTIGWVHADNGYDLAVAAHYEPILHSIACVSDELARSASARLPQRAADIEYVPNAVAVPNAAPERSPLDARALRLVYVGRVAEAQKRVSALPILSERLTRLGVRHVLRIVGDGPALPDITAAARTTPSIEIVGPVAPASVAAHLAWADACVLPSRYEGQSVAILEAMAAGCVPIVTDVGSGLVGCVEHGRTGFVADAGRDDTPERAAHALAEMIEHARSADLNRVRVAARNRVLERHGERAFSERLLALLDRVHAQPGRRWPTNRPAAFTGTGTSGTTPSDAPARMTGALDALRGRRVAIFGCGQHTLDLAAILAAAPCEIAGFLDEHPGRDHLWGWPIVTPEQADTLCATDIVISSALHEAAIARRCAPLEAKGSTVHRLYAS